MQSMEVEMHNLSERHQAKEAKLKADHAQKEKDLNKLVNSLREQLANSASRS